MALCFESVIASKFTPRDDGVFDRDLEVATVGATFPLVPFGAGVTSPAMWADHSLPGF